MTYKREACIFETPSISNIFILLFTKGNENFYALIVDLCERIPGHLQGLTGRPPTIRSGSLGHKLEDRGCVSIIGLLKMIKILKFSPSETSSISARVQFQSNVPDLLVTLKAP